MLPLIYIVAKDAAFKNSLLRVCIGAHHKIRLLGSLAVDNLDVSGSEIGPLAICVEQIDLDLRSEAVRGVSEAK